MMVMMIAITPSLNASSLPFPMGTLLSIGHGDEHRRAQGDPTGARARHDGADASTRQGGSRHDGGRFRPVGSPVTTSIAFRAAASAAWSAAFPTAFPAASAAFAAVALLATISTALATTTSARAP